MTTDPRAEGQQVLIPATIVVSYPTGATVRLPDGSDHWVEAKDIRAVREVAR